MNRLDRYPAQSTDRRRARRRGSKPSARRAEVATFVRTKPRLLCPSNFEKHPRLAGIVSARHSTFFAGICSGRSGSARADSGNGRSPSSLSRRIAFVQIARGLFGDLGADAREADRASIENTLQLRKATACRRQGRPAPIRVDAYERADRRVAGRRPSVGIRAEAQVALAGASRIWIALTGCRRCLPDRQGSPVGVLPTRYWNRAFRTGSRTRNCLRRHAGPAYRAERHLLRC